MDPVPKPEVVMEPKKMYVDKDMDKGFLKSKKNGGTSKSSIKTGDVSPSKQPLIESQPHDNQKMDERKCTTSSKNQSSSCETEATESLLEKNKSLKRKY